MGKTAKRQFCIGVDYGTNSVRALVVDVRDELGRVQAPTLVIHGAQDRMEPVSGAHVLHETLTCEKELHIIEGSGHLLHLDYKKDEVFASLLDWFRRHL